MQNRNIPLLGYALLGLLQPKPSSGYGLRKIFALTPMMSFSDSPGAIYPALQRLEDAGMIRGRVQEGAGLRRRKIFRLSTTGIAELKKWLAKPVARDDVVRHMGELMLRFAFLDGVLGGDAAARFLKALQRELETYVPSLREYLDAQASRMPVSGRLALESGIRGYEAQLQWARDALATYERKGVTQL